MKRHSKFVVVLLATLFAVGFAREAHAQESICINITATVASVDDPSGFLGGAIHVNDVITGSYVYNPTTGDSNSLPTVGDYWHTAAPYGITVVANGLTFRTDPNNVNFLVEIVNDHGTPAYDNYLLRSYNNIFDVGSNSETHIAWQLDDTTLMALSSEALPAAPPVLADWQSLYGLTIESGRNWSMEYFIRAHVTSATLCGDTASTHVAVCHKGETMLVREKAVSTHLGHGDTLGACQ